MSSKSSSPVKEGSKERDKHTLVGGVQYSDAVQQVTEIVFVHHLFSLSSSNHQYGFG